MSAITQVAVGEGANDVVRKRFRKAGGAALSPAAFGRQSRFALRAFRAFSTRDEALAFLNTATDDGARPVDLAAESEESFDRAVALLSKHAAGAAS